MVHLAGMAVFLSALWLLLSGYLIGWLLVLGIASVLVALYIVHRMEFVDHETFPIHLTVRGLGYFPWLLKEIVVSNVTVARAIIAGPTSIQPQVFTVDASQDSELGQVVYANSITLTPGTVSTGLEDGQITVHALLHETAESVRAGEMDRRIARMTNAALPPRSPSPPSGNNAA